VAKPKKAVHYEHCTSCIDALCGILMDPELTNIKKNVTCKACLKLLKRKVEAK